jgi:hypothetical protein
MPEPTKYDWHKIGVQEVYFVNFSEVTQYALAVTIRKELEGRLQVQTAGIPEWVAALTMANPLCVIDHALGQFDIGPDEGFAERLATEHHLLPNQETVHE